MFIKRQYQKNVQGQFMRWWGFTFIELVIVACIIVVLSITISSSVVDSSAEAALERDISLILSQLEKVRSLSVTDEVNAEKYELYFSASENETRLLLKKEGITLKGAEPVGIQSRVKKLNQLDLSSDIIFKFNSNGAPIRQDGSVIVKPVIIHISNEKDGSKFVGKVIKIFPYTGFVAVDKELL